MNATSLPQLHVWQAAAHWRAIDLISDLHLSPGLPLTVAAWAHYLKHTKADAVCMLGDVFEAWVGDDSRHQPFEQGLVQAIAQATALRPVFFMVGNRDFLAGPDLIKATGMTALPDPTQLQAWGQTWLLCHGDEQCLDDQVYQATRSRLRSADWQRGFLAHALADRIALAQDMRRQSMQRQADPTETLGDLDAQACRHLLQRAGARSLIHGHTHRPAVHDLGSGLIRHVLSDWNLDDAAAPRAQVLRLTSEGTLRRLGVAAACASV